MKNEHKTGTLTTFSTLAFLMVSCLAVLPATAQTTAFKYQGSLTDGTNPANGSFQMQFKLFDALAGGAQIGSTLNDVPVTATSGRFTVSLDFGASAFTGANRWIEIAVRRNSGESYVTLAPREQIASSPYSVRTLSAAMADDSQKLGGVNAADYITTTNGGTSFIKNQTTQQASSNFNISGNGFVGGVLGVGTAGGAKFSVSSPSATAGNNTAYFEAPAIGPHASNIHYGTTGDWHIRSASPAGRVLIQDTGGNVGIGTGNPTTKLTVSSNSYGISHTDGTVSLSTFLNSVGGWLGTRTNHPLHFYTNDGLPQVTLTPSGNLGIGTQTPGSGLELRGAGIQQRITDATSGNSLVLQGGTGLNTKVTGYNYNTGTPVNLYLSVDGAHTILNPAGGNVGIGALAPNAKLSVSGNITQNNPSFGIPKAIVFVNANATIGRCYNGITGSTTGGCGFSVIGANGTYTVNFGFDVSSRFYSMTSSSVWLPGVAALVGRLGFEAASPNVIHATFWRTSDHAATVSDFTLIVY